MKHTWTPEQEATLRQLYPVTKTADIAKQFGLNLRQIYNKATLLGLKKDQETLAAIYSTRPPASDRAISTRFKPGHKSWNTGMKGWQSGGRSAETQFKSKPPQECLGYLPIGSLRLSKDGYLERKVTDDRTLAPARRWVGVHRLVWIEAHGPIPPKHVVRFKDGQRTAVESEITVDRLECISMRDNARRNHTDKYPIEVRRLHQLKGAITRQVNRIKEESEQ